MQKHSKLQNCDTFGPWMPARAAFLNEIAEEGQSTKLSNFLRSVKYHSQKKRKIKSKFMNPQNVEISSTLLVKNCEQQRWTSSKMSKFTSANDQNKSQNIPLGSFQRSQQFISLSLKPAVQKKFSFIKLLKSNNLKSVSKINNSTQNYSGLHYSRPSNIRKKHKSLYTIFLQQSRSNINNAISTIKNCRQKI